MILPVSHADEKGQPQYTKRTLPIDLAGSFSQQLLFFEIPKEQAGLYACVVLVFAAGVRLVIPLDGMVIDLAELHIGINDNGLHTEDLQRPVAGKAHISPPSHG